MGEGDDMDLEKKLLCVRHKDGMDGIWIICGGNAGRNWWKKYARGTAMQKRKWNGGGKDGK